MCKRLECIHTYVSMYESDERHSDASLIFVQRGILEDKQGQQQRTNHPSGKYGGEKCEKESKKKSNFLPT